MARTKQTAGVHRSARPSPRIPADISMSRVNLHSIPQELVDVIIDYLHNDKHALQTCARVCKNWIPSSRYHLSIKVGHYYGMPGRYSDFLELLSTPCCTLTRFLRRLVIEDNRRLRGLQAPQVAQLLSVFPELRSISIRLEWGDETWHKTELLFSGFTKVTDVSIGGTYFNDFNDVLELACSFPSLESLCLRQLFWDEYDVLSSRIPLPRTLHVLHMETYNCNPALNWLMSIKPTPSLDTIHITRASWSNLSRIGDFLRVLGDTLLRVQLNFYATLTLMTGDGIAEYIDLSHNTSLRSLTVDYSEGDFIEEPLVDRKYLTDLFSRISSPHIEEILMIKPELKEIADISPAVWANMRQIFGQPHFACLKRIMFTLNADRIGSLADLIRQCLPECHKRGILVFKAG